MAKGKIDYLKKGKTITGKYRAHLLDQLDEKIVETRLELQKEIIIFRAMYQSTNVRHLLYYYHFSREKRKQNSNNRSVNRGSEINNAYYLLVGILREKAERTNNNNGSIPRN